MLGDQLGDGLGGDPGPRKVHFTLAAGLDGVAIHACPVMRIWSNYCWWAVFIIGGKVLHDAYHHVLVHSLSSLSVFLCL